MKLEKKLENVRMKYGKWNGERLADIPDSYWLWLRKQGLNDNLDVREWLQQNKARLDALEKDDWK